MRAVESETPRSAQSSSPSLRAYAIVHPGVPLFYERVSTLLEMLECPVALAAPVGSMLLRDADDGDHGVVCAERVIGGWVVREAAGG